MDKSVEKLSGGGCGGPGGGFGGPGGGFLNLSSSSGLPLLLLSLKPPPGPPKPPPDSFSTDLSTVVSRQLNRDPIGQKRVPIGSL